MQRLKCWMIAAVGLMRVFGSVQECKLTESGGYDQVSHQMNLYDMFEV